MDLLLVAELEQAYLVEGLEYVHIEYDEHDYPSCTFMGNTTIVRNYYDNGGTWGYEYIPDILRDLRVRGLQNG